MAKKRERLEVIHDILSTVRNNRNSIKRTNLLQKCNLSNQMFKDYTNELIEKKMIMKICDDRNKKFFSLTQKGFKFLERYKTIVRFMSDFGF